MDLNQERLETLKELFKKNPTPSALPKLLAEKSVILNARRVSVGYNLSFEIKIIISNLNKIGFIELTSFEFFGLLINLDRIINDLEQERKIGVKICENIFSKPTITGNKKSVKLLNSISLLKIDLDIFDLKELLAFKPLFQYYISKLDLNASSVKHLYEIYVSYCFEKETNALVTFDLSEIVKTDTNFYFSLDFIELFYIIPAIFKEKLSRDIQNLDDKLKLREHLPITPTLNQNIFTQELHHENIDVESFLENLN